MHTVITTFTWECKDSWEKRQLHVWLNIWYHFKYGSFNPVDYSFPNYSLPWYQTTLTTWVLLHLWWNCRLVKITKSVICEANYNEVLTIIHIRGACSNPPPHPPKFLQTCGDFGTRSWIILRRFYVWSFMLKFFVV